MYFRSIPDIFDGSFCEDAHRFFQPSKASGVIVRTIPVAVRKKKFEIEVVGNKEANRNHWLDNKEKV
jgi:hypothetical protein